MRLHAPNLTVANVPPLPLGEETPARGAGEVRVRSETCVLALRPHGAAGRTLTPALSPGEREPETRRPIPASPSATFTPAFCRGEKEPDAYTNHVAGK